MSVMYKDADVAIQESAPMIEKTTTNEKTGYRVAKRTMDIFCSSIALIVLLPLLIISCIAIVAYDFGSPFYLQDRVGKDGKKFKIFKLRTMRKNAHQLREMLKDMNESEGATFKVKKDPRITKPGEFLRKTSIDELPQFWNVLKGDMSFIGPRPPLPREVVLYTPDQMDRLLVKGGLSCICQTEGRSDMEFDKWVEGDVKYIKTRSAGLDIKLMFKTAAAVILRKGAK